PAKPSVSRPFAQPTGPRRAPYSAPDAPLSVSRSREREDCADAFAFESKRSPAVAAIAALPELAVGEAREEATGGREECVGHRWQRLRQPCGSQKLARRFSRARTEGKE